MCKGVDYRELVVTMFYPRTQQLGLQTLGVGDIHCFQEAWGRDDASGVGGGRDQMPRPAFSQLISIPHPQQHTSAVTAHTAFSYRTEDREMTASGASGARHRHAGRDRGSSSDTRGSHLY